MQCVKLKIFKGALSLPNEVRDKDQLQHPTRARTASLIGHPFQVTTPSTLPDCVIIRHQNTPVMATGILK